MTLAVTLGGRFAAALVALTVLVLPARAIEIERVTSPGGIEAWLVSEPTVPLVTLNFAFRGGAAQDPAEKPGVANLVSSLLDEGAGDLNSQAFQERLSELAVEINFDASRDAFYGQMRTLTENLDEATGLLRLALNEPRFDDDAIERMRSQIESGLRRELQDPNAVAGRVWSEAAFGDHPYGRPVNGTLETVATVTAEDIRAFHARTLARDNLVVAVVGNVDAETLAPILDEVFGGLPEAASLDEVADATVDGSDGATVVEMDIPQTVVQFGRPGLKRHDEDFIPAFVANHILGGGSFSSRLFREVREVRGLAYSVYTYLYPLEHSALFVGGVATRNDRAGQSLDIIREEIRRFAADGPTEEELEQAKRYLKGSYALRFDTSARIARQLVELQLEDLGIDYINTRNDLIDAVTMEDVRRAAARLLDEGQLSVVLVGRPDGVEMPADGG